jgi:hypothetical protein
MAALISSKAGSFYKLQKSNKCIKTQQLIPPGHDPNE